MTEDKQLRKWLKNKYGISVRRELDFIVEYAKTGNATDSYVKTFETTNRNSASVLSLTLLKKYNVSFIDALDYAGHGSDSISKALDTLAAKDPDKYLKHITKLKQLDIQKIELDGNLNFNVKIDTNMDDDEY